MEEQVFRGLLLVNEPQYGRLHYDGDQCKAKHDTPVIQLRVYLQ